MSDTGDMRRAAILLLSLLIFHAPALPQGRTGQAAAGGHRLAPAGGHSDPWMSSAAAGDLDALPPNHSAAPGELQSAPVIGFNALFGLSLLPQTLPRPDTADTAAAPPGKKSSWTAVGLSALLPGAGQVYTENYWKVPIIWGLGGYWVYEWTRNHDRYKEFRDLYSQSVRTSPPYGDDRYLRLREFYKDQRDSFAWYLGILYLLNVVDAYVGAELYDFDVGPDLGAAPGGGMRASLTIRF